MGAKRRIELLAPAKDLATARAAIQHGADAVYIGAPRFGARAAAGVSLEDLRLLCDEAHLFGVRIYVALNTILYDDELNDAQKLIWDIYKAGADAVIVQDLGITMMELPPIPLHSSTQCDTISVEDALHLEALGFEQIVLARELNIEQIRHISDQINTPLEVFVHGALCVSYSGRCYISHALTNRSANRGTCSQQCRMPYDLRDSRGTLIRQSEHLLSPKDLNRSSLLEDLLVAGVSSFKIEGRLKGESYVKNITAYYRQELDKIIARYPDKYERSSLGVHTYKFTPQLDKSFNRGFTDYQLDIANLHSSKRSLVNTKTPKSQGEYIGTLKQCTKEKWAIDTQKELTNGDGLLYITPQGDVGGVNINMASSLGVLHPARRIQLPIGTQIYRNYDKTWEDKLSQVTADRRLPIRGVLKAEKNGFTLTFSMLLDPYVSAFSSIETDLQIAKRFDDERLKMELSKVGDTIFVMQEVFLDFGGNEYFVPLSLLSQARREASSNLLNVIKERQVSQRSLKTPLMKSIDRLTLPRRPYFTPDYRANVANHLARKHYQLQGYSRIDSAFELEKSQDSLLMCTKYCIKYELGYCTRINKDKMPYVEPLYLCQGKNKIRLDFDCVKCEMHLLSAE